MGGLLSGSCSALSKRASVEFEDIVPPLKSFRGVVLADGLGAYDRYPW
jgi:hypothetical protein